MLGAFLGAILAVCGAILLFIRPLPFVGGRFRRRWQFRAAGRPHLRRRFRPIGERLGRSGAVATASSFDSKRVCHSARASYRVLRPKRFYGQFWPFIAVSCRGLAIPPPSRCRLAPRSAAHLSDFQTIGRAFASPGCPSVASARRCPVGKGCLIRASSSANPLKFIFNVFPQENSGVLTAAGRRQNFAHPSSLSRYAHASSKGRGPIVGASVC